MITDGNGKGGQGVYPASLDEHYENKREQRSGGRQHSFRGCGSGMGSLLVLVANNSNDGMFIKGDRDPAV